MPRLHCILFLSSYHLVFPEGASSLPLSINTLGGYNASDEILAATSTVGSKEPRSGPEVQKQVPVIPQSPLTKKTLTPIYGNADTLKAQTLPSDLSSLTASCPDIPSHVYYNSTNIVNNKRSKLPEVPNCVVHSVSSSDSVSNNNLKSSEVAPQMVQSESTSVTSHIYNITDVVGQKTTPNQSPKVAIRTTPVKTALTKEASDNDSHLVEVIKNQFPHISRVVIAQFLIRNGGNTDQAVKDIKLSQLTNMKLDGITEADCRTILEQCNWDLSRAAKILCS